MSDASELVHCVAQARPSFCVRPVYFCLVLVLPDRLVLQGMSRQTAAVSLDGGLGQVRASQGQSGQCAAGLSEAYKS